MAQWVNRTLISAPRNGTTSHTLTFAAATVDNFLVAIFEASVTHTIPTGWTRRAQALNNTELSVYTKTATAGESSATTTHNGSDYPMGAIVYEFPAGTTWVGGLGSVNVATGSQSGPNLTGLTGTNLLFGAMGQGRSNASVVTATWTAPSGIVEDVDLCVVDVGGTDGFFLGVAYVEDSTAASFNPTHTNTFTPTREHLSFAINVPAGGTPVTGELAGTTPAVVAALDGVVGTAVSGALAGTTPEVTAALTGSSTATGALAGTTPAVTAALTGAVGSSVLTVTPGPARPVASGSTVDLDVVALPPVGETITSHAWTIQSGGGSLTGAATATPTYTPPASSSTTAGTAVVRDTVTASDTSTETGDVTVGYGPTVVAGENVLTGTARATWDLDDPNFGGVTTLQGFLDGFTVDKGDVASFKIGQSDTAGWSADLYRLGYYGGDGARLITTLTPSSGQLTSSQAQPTPGDADSTTTQISADCANWSTTLTWTPPAWAVSGMYVLRLNRTGGGASHVLFILRDDARAADLMLMPADSTWQAYNAFGGLGGSLYSGNSLYQGTNVNQYATDCAKFVSYNRPIVNRGACDTGRNYGAVEWSNFFTGEYPMLRFLERNGVDVKYYGCIDAAGDPDGDLLASVNAAMMVGHNEYWSDAMRAGWEAARDNGTSLFSCAGNEVFWRMVGDQADIDGRPRRFECYKSTINGRGDTRPEWTGTWRDPDGAGKGGDNPENSLTGTIFVVNGPNLQNLVVPFTGGYSAQPIWRDTTPGDLTTGSWTSPGQILGFEWDTYGPAGVSTTASAFLADPHPDVRYCSTVTHSVGSGLLLTDAGDVYDAAGTATHRLVAYPNPDRTAMVFGTGTINWALGCDSANTYQQGNNNVSVVIQQATLNVLTDMGAPPSTLMAGMVQPDPVDWFPNVEGALDGTTPAVTSALAGTSTATGALAGTTPAVLGDLAGASSSSGAVAGTTPEVTASLTAVSTATGALAGTTPAVVGDLAGAATADGALAGTTPAVVGDFAGVVGSAVAGALDATTPAVVGDLSGTSTASGALAGTIPSPVADLAATAGDAVAGSLAGITPAVVSALAGTSTGTGLFEATTPAVTSDLAATLTALAALAGTTPEVLVALTGFSAAGPPPRDVEIVATLGPQTRFTVQLQEQS